MAAPSPLHSLSLPLILGGNTFGWTSDRTESWAVMDAFAEAGGTVIDTADNYSWWAEGNVGGESETIIGEWIRARNNRESTVVATKVGRHPDFAGLSAPVIARGLEASLKRLGTDYIDVYYAHWDDPKTPLDETVAAFEELRVSGKIRSVAVSNYSGARLQGWLDAADAIGAVRPVALQPHYNLAFRTEFESDVRPIVESYDLGVVPYFGLASGFLAGKYRSLEDIEKSPRASMLKPYFSERALTVIDGLHEIADSHSVTPATVALAWLRKQQTVLAPLASASRLDQVKGLVESARLELTSDELDRLSELSAGLPDAV